MKMEKHQFSGQQANTPPIPWGMERDWRHGAGLKKPAPPPPHPDMDNKRYAPSYCSYIALVFVP